MVTARLVLLLAPPAAGPTWTTVNGELVASTPAYSLHLDAVTGAPHSLALQGKTILSPHFDLRHRGVDREQMWIAKIIHVTTPWGNRFLRGRHHRVPAIRSGVAGRLDRTNDGAAVDRD